MPASIASQVSVACPTRSARDARACAQRGCAPAQVLLVVEDTCLVWGRVGKAFSDRLLPLKSLALTSRSMYALPVAPPLSAYAAGDPIGG
jgi:hypothetical protein